VKLSPERDAAHAQLIQVLPGLFRRLVIRQPNQVDGFPRVTHEQFAVLCQLQDHGEQSMGEIASARNVALNTATALVDRLVLSGLAARRSDLLDRRIVRVAVTNRGDQLATRLRSIRRDAVRAMLDDLPDADIEAILHALPALARLAEAPNPSAPAAQPVAT
jgi:DNA-binding MarR family transcriptional regulator